MKSHLSGNAHFALAFAAAFVFSVALGVCIRPASLFAQESATAPKAHVELMTVPSPAHKGMNIVKVKLTDSTGEPITDAEVSVEFYMPAMPSMGMAAMKTVIKGVEKARGMYEGKSDLDSGGTWQVTITAKKNGQVIATKKIAVKATGM